MPNGRQFINSLVHLTFTANIKKLPLTTLRQVFLKMFTSFHGDFSRYFTQNPSTSSTIPQLLAWNHDQGTLQRIASPSWDASLALSSCFVMVFPYKKHRYFWLVVPVIIYIYIHIILVYILTFFSQHSEGYL